MGVVLVHRFWSGLQYGLATLATSMSETLTVLHTFMYQVLSVLCVDRTLKHGWRLLSHAFLGIGLFSLLIEQIIFWLNMLIKQFGEPTTLCHKFRSSLGALQLEVGTQGNPLIEPYDRLHILATPC